MKKPKRVSYELIVPDSIAGYPIYSLMAGLIAEHHAHLAEARIAVAWCTSWKPDVDGRVILGQCKRASDLSRELVAFDFVILLRRSFWLDLRVTDSQREALMDHELCHAEVAREDGSPQLDERGRIVYRLRKHDIEEFTEIVNRHGCYKGDLERFAAALRRSAVVYRPCEQCRDDTPGWTRTVDSAGAPRLARCACYVAWAQQKEALAS